LPNTPTLDHLRERLVAGRIEPRVGMTAHEISILRRSSDRMPSLSGLLLLARAQALNGRPEDAAETLDRLCRTHQVTICANALALWSEAAQQGGPLMTAVLSPRREE
jgi:hypothetical protein